MTGSEIFESFLVDIQEVMTGYLDPTRANSIFNEASYNMLDKKYQEFQSNGKITGEVEPLILRTVLLTLSSAQLDITKTSTALPSYYRYLSSEVTSPYRGATITRVPKERKYNQFNSNYSAGDARYPRYFLSAGKLNFEPTDAVSARVFYFRTPFTIDVEDSTIDIPYNDKLVGLIKSEAMIILGIAGRDPAIIQGGQIQKTTNP